MDREDQTIQCSWKGCKDEFTFTAGEQEFYERKGFTPPKYCKPHREQRRSEYNARQNNKAPRSPQGYHQSDRDLVDGGR